MTQHGVIQVPQPGSARALPNLDVEGSPPLPGDTTAFHVTTALVIVTFSGQWHGLQVPSEPFPQTPVFALTPLVPRYFKNMRRHQKAGFYFREKKNLSGGL